ncbi:hypothetical protein ACFV3D_24390, partial [Streptomyces sp. NPDC059708]
MEQAVRAPEGTVHKVVKSLWIAIWLFYLSAPVTDLVRGGHSDGARLLGGLGLLVFVGWYLALVFRGGPANPGPAGRQWRGGGSAGGAGGWGGGIKKKKTTRTTPVW